MDIKQYEEKMKLAVGHFLEELKKVRTGRASASMLDGVMVKAYGAEMPLNQVANVTAPEAQLIQITPFDPGNIQAIASAIRDNPTLGLNPMDDGRVVRVPIPALNEERRREYVKVVSGKAEDAMVALRSIRHDAMDHIDQQKKSKDIGEDDAKRLEKQTEDAMAKSKSDIEAATKAKRIRDNDHMITAPHDENSLVVPTHIGYILDGNRRWARAHTLPEYDGHLAGYNALTEVLEASFEQGVKFVSIYAFSTENWKRDKTEVSNLMKLTVHALGSDLKRFVQNGTRVRCLGHREGLSEKIVNVFEKAEQATRLLTNGTALICFNYGGQKEIADAARKCVADGLKPAEVTEEAIASRLYAPDVPPVDLVVRTSGEQRLSNFMLWRIAYSELLFLSKYWPEMTKQDVTDIIKEYTKRSRRFGS